jgi:hypothetical protein
MNLNWSDHVLITEKENISLNDHLLNLFLEEWLTTINYSMYFQKCAPSFCTYKTIVKTNFVYAFTLLISLYGGLVFIFRLIAPFMVNITLEFKRHSRNIRINSGIC